MENERAYLFRIATAELAAIVYKKPGGYQAMRLFSPALPLRVVLEALRVEFPSETGWAVWTAEGQRALPADDALGAPWQVALRGAGAKPIYPYPEPVVYALTTQPHVQ